MLYRTNQPVLLTGAGGRADQAILGHIGDACDWRLLDREPFSDGKIPDSVDSTEVYVADVIDKIAARNAMDDAHAVIHLMGDPRPEASWDSVLRNSIDSTQQMFDAVVDVGVEKFAFASSNYVVGTYETTGRTPDMYRPYHEFRLDGMELPCPSNLCGVSKAVGETLGRYYHDHHNTSVMNVRIGNLIQHHPPKEYERGQAMWLSYRDCGHLFECCIEADYDYKIVYGTSDNDRKYYSIDRARVVLGCDPQDNSAEFTFRGESLDGT